MNSIFLRKLWSFRGKLSHRFSCGKCDLRHCCVMGCDKTTLAGWINIEKRRDLQRVMGENGVQMEVHPLHGILVKLNTFSKSLIQKGFIRKSELCHFLHFRHFLVLSCGSLSKDIYISKENVVWSMEPRKCSISNRLSQAM